MKEETIQELIKEVLSGLKNRMIQPLREENRALAAAIASLQEKITYLEQKVDESPLLMLAALRDAINHARGEERDGPAS